MQVRCNSCGKFIPYHGDVCPYCQADKTASKASMDRVYKWAGAGAVLGAVCVVFTDGPWAGGICFGLFGMFFGGIVGAIYESLRSKR